MWKYTIFILLLCQSLNGQTISEKLENYQSSHHIEKIYLGHDKPYYTSGDTMWCKVYFVDGRTHKFFDASPVVSVDWISPQDSLLNSWQLKIDDGIAYFENPLDYSLSPGEYTIRAHTQYQRNFDQGYLFQKSIRIISEESVTESLGANKSNKLDFNLKFFPEGGDMIAGIKNKVAFKAQNENGENLDVTGILVDEDDTEIQNFKSYVDGIGFVEFTPEPGKKYSVKVRYEEVEKNIKLPDAKKSGYVLSVNNRSQDFIAIELSSNTNQLLAGARLVAHVRGLSFLDTEFDQVETQKLKLSKSDIPSGLIQFTVFDQKGRPVCERLSFNKNPDENVDVEFLSSATQLGQRQKVDLEIRSHQDMKTVPSYLSVSVYNKDLFPSDEGELNIVNYLLLKSDMRGDIPNINQYFLEDNAKTNFLLDLLMLTHGWSRFTWQDIKDEKFPEMEFATKEDISLIGRIKKRNKEETVKADVLVNIFSKDEFSNVNMTTEDDGIFYFKGFEFRDTTDIMIQANIHDAKKKKKLKEGETKRVGSNNVDIEILELDPLAYDKSITIKNSNGGSVDLDALLKNYNEAKKIEALYNPDWNIDLDEITVKAQRKTKQEKKLIDLEDKMKDRGMFYFPSSQKVFMDDIPGGGLQYTGIFQVLRGRVPGVEIVGTGPERAFVIRNTSNISGFIPATVMIDGFEVRNLEALSITPQNILAIDVIKGLYATSVFGESGAGGVISIISKEPGEVTTVQSAKKNRGTLNIKNPGFYNGREYYSPNYAKKTIDHQKPDYRTTLFWDPNINIGKSGKKVSFYTGDTGGNFVIMVEGITEAGYPFVSSQELVITKE